MKFSDQIIPNYGTAITNEKVHNRTYPYTIVTAASDNHFCALQSWLYKISDTLKDLSEEQKPRIIVYDLGIAKYQKKVLRLLKKKGKYFDKLIKFDYKKYPKFWNIDYNRGEYAWKSGIIKEVSMTYPGIIIWLDSGSFITSEFFINLEILLEQNNGFLSPKSSGSFLKWTHPGVFKYFNQSTSMYRGKHYVNCNGAAIVFDTNKTQYLIDKWNECALVKNCIAPKGSSRANHRQDQAILTFLIINDNRSCDHELSHIGIKTHMDEKCAQNIYYYDKLHGEFYWPTSEDLEELRQLKETYDLFVFYDIWNEGALEELLANMKEEKVVT
ncbi:9674_t:CDS:2 [Funneliformis mosseae]|uniref:9674_t:CDS:1 n=1 Tax=Funneliformis mosseae TaxID=27381 RepID=A0A9N9BBJ4_FUNMO|nr:9674_t:CDS:2 [Funneliformis mosseae]